MARRSRSLREAGCATVLAAVILLMVAMPGRSGAADGRWVELTSVPVRTGEPSCPTAMMWDDTEKRLVLMNPRTVGALDPWQFRPEAGWSRLALPSHPADARTLVRWIVPDPARRRLLVGAAPSSPDTVDWLWALELAAPSRWVMLGRLPARYSLPIASVSSERSWCLSHGSNTVGLWSLALADATPWQLDRLVPLPRTIVPAVVDAPRGRVIGFSDFGASGDSVQMWSAPIAGTDGWTRVVPSGLAWPLGYATFLFADTTRARLVFLVTRFPVKLELWACDVSALGAWTKLGSAPDAAALCQAGDTLWAHGIRDSLGTHGGRTVSVPLNDPESWTLRSDVPRPELMGFEALLHDARHGVWWGLGERKFNISLAPTGFDSLWCMRLSGDDADWSRVTLQGPAPPPRTRAGWAVDEAGHVAYLWSGVRVPDQRTFHDLWALDLIETPRWRLLLADDPTQPGYSRPGLVFDPVARRLVGMGHGANGATLDIWDLAVDSLPAWHAHELGELPGAIPGYSVGEHSVLPSAVYDARHERVAFVTWASHTCRLALELRPEMRWIGGPVDCTDWNLISGHCLPYVYSSRGFYDPVGGRVLELGGGLDDIWILTASEPTDSLGPFRRMGDVLQQYVYVASDSPGGYDASLDALVVRPDAGGLPPLAFHFDRGGAPPVPVAAATVLDDHIALRWTAAPGEQYELSRRAGSGRWMRIATLVASAQGELGYDDHAIEAGQNYGYRLGAPATPDVPVGEDVWVIASTAPSFTLGRAWPNPSHDRVNLSFTLLTPAAATLDVVDIAGRRVWSQRLQGLGPGPHVASLDRARIGRPGLYFVRLTQSGLARTTRVVWVP